MAYILGYTSQDPYPSDQEVCEHADGSVTIHMPSATPQVFEEYEQAIAQYPQDARLRIEYASYLRHADLPRTIEHLRVAVGLEPDSADAHGLLASLLRQSGEIQPALEEYRQALALSAKDSEQAEVLLHWGLAETLKQSGDIEQARTHLQRAITRQQEYVDNKRGSHQLLHMLETQRLDLGLPKP